MPFDAATAAWFHETVYRNAMLDAKSAMYGVRE